MREKILNKLRNNSFIKHPFKYIIIRINNKILTHVSDTIYKYIQRL